MRSLFITRRLLAFPGAQAVRLQPQSAQPFASRTADIAPRTLCRSSSSSDSTPSTSEASPSISMTATAPAPAVVLPEAHYKQAKQYIDLLLEMNKVMNLTAVTDPDEAMQRHVHDCLTLLPVIDKYIPDAANKPLKVMDVGSGGGLPGVILAIARPNWEVTCLDALRKRCDFVEKTVKECGINNVHVLWSRAEDAGQDKTHREKYDVVVSRAVADMRVLSEYCIPFNKVGGYFVAPKGADCEEEIKGSKKALSKLGGKVVSIEGVESFSVKGQRVAVVIHKEKACPGQYPRKPGTPKAKPL